MTIFCHLYTETADHFYHHTHSISSGERIQTDKHTDM